MKLFPWLAFTFLVGCSSPYQFSHEISSFRTGVDDVSSAYTTGYNNLANDRQTYQALIFGDTSAKLKLTTSCNPAAPSALPCDFYRQGEPQPSPSDPALESSRPKTLGALKVVTDYAHALQAVTNAADRAAFDSAASRLNASVTALLAKVPNPAVAASGAAFSVGFNVFAWVFGQALDQERFDTLKQDVNLANGPLQRDDHKGLACPEQSVCSVQSVAKGLGTELDAISQARQLVVYDTVNALIKPLGPGYKNYTARQAAASQTKALLIQLEQTNPSRVTDALIKAHNALRDAVNDPKQSFSNLATAVGQFAGLAEALKNALTTPAKTPPTTPGS
jgi:hypothetical protein